MLPVLAVLLGLPFLVFVLVAFNHLEKRRHAQRVQQRLRDRLLAHGLTALDATTYRWEDMVFTFRIDPWPLLTRRYSVRLSLYVNGFYEFEIRQNLRSGIHSDPSAGGGSIARPFYQGYSIDGMKSPELWEYLQSESVHATLQKLLPGRWRSFSMLFVEMVLYDNEFDVEAVTEDDLLEDVRALKRLAAAPLVRRDLGGLFTVRCGFEADLPAWHWTPDTIQALPPGITRVAVSCYHGDPLLGLPLVELFQSLAPDHCLFWISREREFEPLFYAMGECAESLPPLVVTSNPLFAVAADHISDGRFFSGLIAVPRQDRDRWLETHLDRFRRSEEFRWHAEAMASIGDAHFYVRRLFDDGHTWYSGEYEIMSLRLTPQAIEEAVRRIAQQYGAVVQMLSRRFSHKMLRGE